MAERAFSAPQRVTSHVAGLPVRPKSRRCCKLQTLVSRFTCSLEAFHIIFSLKTEGHDPVSWSPIVAIIPWRSHANIATMGDRGSIDSSYPLNAAKPSGAFSKSNNNNVLTTLCNVLHLELGSFILDANLRQPHPPSKLTPPSALHTFASSPHDPN